MIKCSPLGQSGFILEYKDTRIYIDPYLSDSVEKIEGTHLKRMVPVPVQPDTIHDADWVLITHIHLDHCDLETLIPLAASSPECRFIGPNEVCHYLIENGFPNERVIMAPDNWLSLESGLRIHATPAAHPTIEIDQEGFSKYLGYIIELDGKRIYHSGDTFLKKEIITFVQRHTPIDTAFLPVNEHNYARETMGILGNMGIRDAFEFASILQVKKLVPVHWDMFQPNAVFKEEIELLFELLKPPFEMVLNPSEL